MSICIDNLSSLDALLDALGNLDNLCEAIEDAYISSLRENQHEVWEEESWSLFGLKSTQTICCRISR